MADLCKQGDNSLNCTKVVIAFVPGVMGSRLSFTAGGSWDPDDKSMTGVMSRWYMAGADSERAQLKFDKGANVIVGNSGKKISPPLTPDESNKGYGGIVWSFYGPFARLLAGTKFGTFQTPVYVFGYDWRQSNKVSGADLATRINNAIDAEKTDKVIIVSHSMGGLATRSALFQNATLSGRLLGIIHVFQPATGAVVLYRRFYTGMVQNVDAATSAECTVFGDTADKFATIVSGLNGPMELLPNANYVDDVPAGASWKATWLDYTVPGPPPTPVSLGGSNIYLVYTMKWPASLFRCSQHPPGLGGRTTKTAVVPADLALRLDVAEAFHKELGAYKHDKTFAIYGSGETTDARFLQDSSGTNRYADAQQRRSAGDGTVPATSASSLFPGQAYTSADICNSSARQFQVTGVQHAAAFSDTVVQGITLNLIRRILGILCPPSSTGQGASSTGATGQSGTDASSTTTADNSSPDDSDPNELASADDEDGGASA